MTRSSAFITVLLLLALTFTPSVAQRDNANRADRANERANAVEDARVRNNPRTQPPEARIGAAAFREDIARNKGDRIDGEFIVQLNGDCDGRCRGKIQSSINADAATRGCTIGKRQIKIGGLRFVNLKCPEGRNLRRDKVDSAIRPSLNSRDAAQISLVEEDFVVTLDGVSTSLWGVDEADGGVTVQGGSAIRDSMRTCSDTSNNGQGVDVWILDTGCAPTFGGKCFGYFGGSCFDGNGHGSHVGGTATDALYGVAPQARKNCVKVLNDRGSGSYFIAIQAIEYVLNNKGPNGNIINFSLSGPSYLPLNNAVEAAAAEGVYFTLAAGNAAQPVCGFSPASAVSERVFAVQAHDVSAAAAWFTNYSTASEDCTHLSAPGVAITSFGGTVSGTSMAAPHVAGAIALLISDNRDPTLDTLTANGVSIAPGGVALSKSSLGLACT